MLTLLLARFMLAQKTSTCAALHDRVARIVRCFECQHAIVQRVAPIL